MQKTSLKIFFTALWLLCAGCCGAQNLRPYEQLVTQQDLVSDLSFIASDEAGGRESGTLGKAEVEQFIVRRFRNLGLKPVNWSYTQSFLHSDTLALRNVTGYLPALHRTDKYVIVCAHYDHLGTFSGHIYNGADDNASGVTAMLALARMFSSMKHDGVGPAKNILFVAFDGKEMGMAGSYHFMETLPIPKKNITCVVNLDILGANLVPPGVNSDYLIALGENTLDERYQGYLSYLCRKALYKMDLDLTFYGSKNFTRMMYESSDQYPFVKAGIPAVLFTSAFNSHTLRPTDRIDIINFPLLRRRTLVIFNFINRLCSE